MAHYGYEYVFSVTVGLLLIQVDVQDKMGPEYDWDQSLANDVLKDICQRKRQANYNYLKLKTNLIRPKGRPKNTRTFDGKDATFRVERRTKAITGEALEAACIAKLSQEASSNVLEVEKT